MKSPPKLASLGPQIVRLRGVEPDLCSYWQVRGGSLSEAIQRSEVVSGQFTQIAHVHIEKPPILRNARYLIVIRNPIRRAISAFNWRYRLVVQDKAQTDRFEGEYDILLQYKSLNVLAEALYDTKGHII